MQPDRQNILIAGGGIGGMSAALALQRKGFSCHVMEQALTPDETGAGLQLSPNAMHVLKALGLSEQVEAAAFEPAHAILRDFRTGNPEMCLLLKARCRVRYGAPYLHIHRADLHHILSSAARRAGTTVQTGVTATGYGLEENRATLFLADGSQQSADILVGADGIHSSICARMPGSHTARFTGKVAWRGVVSSDRLPKGRITPDANVWAGPGRHFVSYYLRRGDIINFVAVEERDCWTHESWKKEGNTEELRTAFTGWDPCIRDLLEACDTCYLWGLFDRKPLPRWYDGRVVLLGDACHPMLPFMAQGAAMAIEDAYALAETLSTPSRTIGVALNDYERRRKPRTSRLQSISRRNAKLYHPRSGFMRMARKLGFRIGGWVPGLLDRPFNSIYGYNITTPG